MPAAADIAEQRPIVRIESWGLPRFRGIAELDPATWGFTARDADRVIEMAVVWPLAHLLPGKGLYLLPAASVARANADSVESPSPCDLMSRPRWSSRTRRWPSPWLKVQDQGWRSWTAWPGRRGNGCATLSPLVIHRKKTIGKESSYGTTQRV